MRYRTDKTGKIVRYKKQKREVMMFDDDTIYEPSFDECVDEVLNDPDDIGETDDPVLRHHINMLQTLLQHRLNVDVSDINWDAMTWKDVKEIEHEANMTLLQQSFKHIK